MATLAFFTDETTWEIGDLVCVDSSNGFAVQYDPLDPKPVIGVSLKPNNSFNPNGRGYFAINGIPYYENDFYVYEEDLTTDFSTENTSYSPFNPLTDAGYITAITNGIAALKSSISSGIPSAWILLKSNTNYNSYLIR
jgi:hypothetical protein